MANPTQPNPQDLPDLIAVDPSSDEVCCDGGGGALGHPQVWYSFDGRQEVTCGYCDRRFVRSRAVSPA